MMRRWTIAVGNFFFKYRNGLFPLLFVLAALVARPRTIGTPAVDRALVLCGMGVALTGQLARLVTIGYEYIERGGKAGKVYASRLVQGGVYALTRNPMYLGNGLIAIGMTMVAGAPLLYATVLPLFLYIYHAIIAAEEAYLRRQFGAEYETYCASVNRIIPSLSKALQVLGRLRYRWREAVRKDLSTMAGLLLSLILLPAGRRIWLDGWAAVREDVPQILGGAVGVLVVYAIAVTLKRQRKVFYEPEPGA